MRPHAARSAIVAVVLVAAVVVSLEGARAEVPRTPPLPTAIAPRAAGLRGPEIAVPLGSTVKTSCDHSAVHVSICSGGSCTEALTAPCAPYGCNKDKTWCASSCVSSADCAAGSSCATANGKCAWDPNTCADTFVIQTADGSLASCAPYKCLAGRCQQQCETDVDCSAGYACKDNVACVKK
jgi:hypothetical protein